MDHTKTARTGTALEQRTQKRLKAMQRILNHLIDFCAGNTPWLLDQNVPAEARTAPLKALKASADELVQAVSELIDVKKSIE